MLCLNASDIEKAVSPAELIEAMVGAMVRYEQKEFFMPQRTHLDFAGNTLLLMPCFSQKSFATKLVSLFPNNRAKNRQVLYGTVILNDGQTGEPLAIFNGAKLTAMRTGAVGGAAARYLTPVNVSSLGLFGAGVQAFHQALFACAERPITDIYLFDPFSKKLDQFIKELSKQLRHVAIHRAGSAEEALSSSALVITATNARTPVLPDSKELLANKYIIGIGSYKPDMREFPQSLFHLVNRYVLDTKHAQRESGDVIEPLKNGWIKKGQLT
jgi:ornithine cyclodeaminase